jgi:hypothetical protein
VSPAQPQGPFGTAKIPPEWTRQGRLAPGSTRDRQSAGYTGERQGRARPAARDPGRQCSKIDREQSAGGISVQIPGWTGVGSAGVARPPCRCRVGCASSAPRSICDCDRKQPMFASQLQGPCGTVKILQGWTRQGRPTPESVRDKQLPMDMGRGNEALDPPPRDPGRKCSKIDRALGAGHWRTNSGLGVRRWPRPICDGA